jgi:hypothetical protein
MGNNPINNVTAGSGTGQALAFQQLFAQGTMQDLASAATTDIGLQNTTFLRITGNTTITSFGTNYRGPRFLVFEGAVILTNSSTLVLPGGANITTAAGDVLIAIPGATLGTADKWVIVSYQKANTVPGYSNIPGGFGFRNRIINGDMRIDQRNAGASVTPANGGGAYIYTLDRWRVFSIANSKFSVQQNAGSVTPPVGFSNYLGITSLAATSVGASDIYVVGQQIEGFNFADFGWGTANAQTVTLSFWVRSSLTGTFGGALQNSAINRTYPFAYNISTANTWEQKTITIAGDTTGTWVGATNGVGCALQLGLGVGSSSSGTAGAWSSSAFFSVTGATSVVGTTGATFYITGVQLEAGTVATPFERRDYGRELMMCQRYLPVYSASSAFGGHAYSASGFYAYITFAVPSRVPPTGLQTTVSGICWNASGSSIPLNSIIMGSTAGRSGSQIFCGVASGLVAGNGTSATNNVDILFTGCEL